MPTMRSGTTAPFHFLSLIKAESSKHGFHYGGQALIEGVMMRGRKYISLSVRRPDGSLSQVVQPLPSIYSGGLRQTPLVRGVVVLIEALVLGTRSLLYSADTALGEENKASPWMIWGMLAVAIVFAIALFFVAPLLLARILDPFIGSSFVSNLIEGILRLGMFVAYLKLINLMPDVKRVFAYHGAEHKVVNAFEHGEPMEPESVKNYSTAHVRCGTSFLLVVLVIAILVFALLGRPSIGISIISRIVLLPFIAALSYEVVQFGARHFNNAVVRALLLPGLALQALTTREPDESQLEVAISALKKVMEADTEASSPPSPQLPA